jgi:iron(III) transport system substrate-binding protein
MKESEDYVRSLKSQKFKIVDGPGRAVADAITAGEADLSPTVYNSHAADSHKRGGPIAWAPMDYNFVTEVVYAIAAHAPHPASALLLGDFLLSREGQELYKAAGYGSAHDEAQGGQANFEKAYFTNMPDYQARFEQWSRLFQEVFLTR